MSSFYAELVIAGRTYPVRQCEFGFSQATDGRGRVQAKVRHGLLHLTLDVPIDDQLLGWAQAAHKPLAGHVTFFETNQRTARETVSFAAGQCVGYDEVFESGAAGDGAYVCQLSITSDGLTLTPGGPVGAFVAPAAGEHGSPAAATVLPVALASAVANSLIPRHLPPPTASPDLQQVHLTTAEWQALTAGRWDMRNNKKFLKQHRNTEFQVADTGLTYRVDGTGKVVAVYDAQKSYNVTGTRKGVPYVPLTLTGQPTFAGTPHMYPPGPPHKSLVVIDMVGNRPADFKLANEAAGLTAVLRAQSRDLTEAPEGYTWHHRDDFKPSTTPPPVGTCTMELVTTDAHEATFVHKGSCDQYNKHVGTKQYK